ncbi:uncharacterized protein PV06_02596 [Exophiala oligosperma]|uniref:Uncharacterized protein n=1 Tax=Exophiala oligosperma TaxID=215243 RepID=A0A0D2EGD4_9EURO|nr:uncharacterized protein PV06_02596 [Exophiala oligosperma]KIW46979.1 hypothetical protein PV06_02596 [Exophiala oligosperma]
MPSLPVTPGARAPDDFDMAKLQKSLKQRQRHAVRNSGHVAKLTPAEIRSLNHNALASATGSQSSSRGSTHSTSRRSTNATPPATPEDHPSRAQAQKHRDSISRRSTVDIPTPPHTPSGHRRPSQSSTRSHSHTPIQGHAHGHIHAPRPRGHGHAAFMAANGLSSRPSSSGSGSSMYRGLPTYRGPEVTHHVSMNMLQRPAADIVSNPLSYFSRPRQSVVSTSPERSRAPQEMPGYQAPTGRNNSVSNISTISSRPPSPPRATDSPVSMMNHDTEQFPALDLADDPHNQPKIQSDDEQHPDLSRPQAEEPPSELPAQLVPELQQPPAEEIPETPKKEPRKRFTLNGALFGGDKSHSNSPESAGKLRKLRRRTLSLGKSPDKEKSEAQEPPNEEQTTVVASPTQVDGATLEDSDMITHPTVQPLSVTIPSEWKGKQKEIHSAPVYARCSCCGKLKRPSGYGNELSPVLENENLRTNFSFEIERSSESSKRRSSDSPRSKYTPIIPMEVAKNDTRQATVEPRVIPTIPMREPRETAMSSPRGAKRLSDPPKFVRFASLHGRRNETTVIDEEEETEVMENAPLMSGGEDQGNGAMADDVVMHDESMTNRPVINIAANVIPAQIAEIEQSPVKVATPEGSHRDSHAGSDSDDFFTPARGTTPVSESVRSRKEKGKEKDLNPTEEGNVFLSLPQPSLGPAFARNSEVLKNYVLARSTSLILSDAGGETDLRATEPEKLPAGENHLLPTVDGIHGLDSTNPKDQKWLSEIIAV